MTSRSLPIAFVALAPVAMAGAQTTKLSGTLQCGKPNPQYAVEVGDAPGHAFGLGKVACTWPKPMQIEGSPTKDGVSVNVDEVKGTKSESHGLHTGTLANGDTVYIKYEGEATLKDGAPQSAQGKWRFKGGTGHAKWIHGKGTYTGTPGADGGMTYQVEGEYEIEAPKAKPKK
jgi:hypothetical protein